MPDESPTPDEVLPDVIIDGLRELDRVPFDVSPEQHNDILQSAREHLKPSRLPRPVRRWRYIVAVTGSVCAALLVFGFMQLGTHDRFDQTAKLQMQADTLPDADTRNPKDIDENGTVDILDAYVMARRLQTNEHDEALNKWDFNSDGQLDEDDIQMVALEAVML